MVVDCSERACLLCGRYFTGRAFLCRGCAERYRGQPMPTDVRQRFYEAVDRAYPEWSNTYGHYNPPHGLLRYADRLPRDSRILEIGAGGGFTLAELRKMGFTNLVGSDLTRSTMAAMRGRLPGMPLVTADAERLPFRDASFDVVLSTDLLEHLPELGSHLDEVRRVLRPEGIYLLKTPNRLLAERYYKARGLYDAHFWHPSMCSPAELRCVLARHGLVGIFIRTQRLTEAQTRKIPFKAMRPLARRVPLGWLPPVARPHLEAVATRR